MFSSLAKGSDWYEQPIRLDNLCHLGPAPRDPIEVAENQTTVMGSLRTVQRF